MIALAVLAFCSLDLTLEGTGELVLNQRSTGVGVQVDGVFGVRAVAAPSFASGYAAVSLDLRVGTLGARASAGTEAVNVRSTDVQSDLLLHLRYPVRTRVLTFLPSVLVGLDMSWKAQTFTAPGLDLGRVAFVAGIGYGLRAALEGERWSVALTVLLVSTDTRAPATFMGLSAGYVFRL